MKGKCTWTSKKALIEGFPSKKTGIYCRTRGIPETNKAAEFPLLDSCGKWSTRQIYCVAYLNELGATTLPDRKQFQKN